MLQSLKNPISSMRKREWILWGISLTGVILSNICTGKIDPVNLAATCIGVTALILVARGDVWGQILTVVFAVLYGITAWRFRYWGEILTYLGMSAPIAAMAVVSWLKHPYQSDRNEVKIHRLTGRQKVFMFFSVTVVTGLFYFILAALDTPNLVFSTLSVTTSYLASYLTFQRNSWYGFAYACNDMVLIVLWVLASMEDITYLPMIACFAMFLINDLYGFISWKKREQTQRTGRT